MKNILAIQWASEDCNMAENMKLAMEGVTSGVKLSTNHTNLYEMSGNEITDISDFFSKLAADEVDTVICLGNEEALEMTKKLDEYAKEQRINAYFIAVPGELALSSDASDNAEIDSKEKAGVYFKLGRNAVSLAEMFRTGIVLTYSSDGLYGAKRI